RLSQAATLTREGRTAKAKPTVADPYANYNSIVEEEKGYRANATQASAEADAADQDLKNYIAAKQQGAGGAANYREDLDPEVQTRSAGIKRSRSYAADQLKRANDLITKKNTEFNKAKQIDEQQKAAPQTGQQKVTYSKADIAKRAKQEGVSVNALMKIL